MAHQGRSFSQLQDKQLGGLVFPYEIPGAMHCKLLEGYAPDRWVVEEWEQYKCREPSLVLHIVGELQAKLALLNRGNEMLPKKLRKTRLPKGSSDIVRGGVKYRITEDSISFKYLDGDTYYGGVKIYRVANFVPFAKRRSG